MVASALTIFLLQAFQAALHQLPASLGAVVVEMECPKVDPDRPVLAVTLHQDFMQLLRSLQKVTGKKRMGIILTSRILYSGSGNVYRYKVLANFT